MPRSGSNGPMFAPEFGPIAREYGSSPNNSGGGNNRSRGNRRPLLRVPETIKGKALLAGVLIGAASIFPPTGKIIHNQLGNGVEKLSQNWPGLGKMCVDNALCTNMTAMTSDAARIPTTAAFPVLNKKDSAGNATQKASIGYFEIDPNSVREFKAVKSNPNSPVGIGIGVTFSVPQEQRDEWISVLGKKSANSTAPAYDPVTSTAGLVVAFECSYPGTTISARDKSMLHAGGVDNLAQVVDAAKRHADAYSRIDPSMLRDLPNAYDTKAAAPSHTAASAFVYFAYTPDAKAPNDITKWKQLAPTDPAAQQIGILSCPPPS